MGFLGAGRKLGVAESALRASPRSIDTALSRRRAEPLGLRVSSVSRQALMNNAYSVLEVPRDATIAAIKERYRFLAQAWHPDKFQSAAHKAQAEAKIKEINAAYAILSDSTRRAAHDDALRNDEYAQASRAESGNGSMGQEEFWWRRSEREAHGTHSGPFGPDVSEAARRARDNFQSQPDRLARQIQDDTRSGRLDPKFLEALASLDQAIALRVALRSIDWNDDVAARLSELHAWGRILGTERLPAGSVPGMHQVLSYSPKSITGDRWFVVDWTFVAVHGAALRAYALDEPNTLLWEFTIPRKLGSIGFVMVSKDRRFLHLTYGKRSLIGQRVFNVRGRIIVDVATGNGWETSESDHPARYDNPGTGECFTRPEKTFIDLDGHARRPIQMSATIQRGHVGLRAMMGRGQWGTTHEASTRPDIGRAVLRGKQVALLCHHGIEVWDLTFGLYDS